MNFLTACDDVYTSKLGDLNGQHLGGSRFGVIIFAMKKPLDVDEYISGVSPDVRALLEEMRAIIRAAAPDAVEAISYGMPAFRLHGQLVFFAAFKSHIGFYALPTGHEEFKEELAAYKTGKGSVQFPLDQPLPADLITRIVKFRVAENLRRAAEKE